MTEPISPASDDPIEPDWDRLPDWISTAESAKVMQYSEDSFRDYASRKELPSRKDPHDKRRTQYPKKVIRQEWFFAFRTPYLSVMSGDDPGGPTISLNNVKSSLSSDPSLFEMIRQGQENAQIVKSLLTRISERDAVEHGLLQQVKDQERRIETEAQERRKAQEQLNEVKERLHTKELKDAQAEAERVAKDAEIERLRKELEEAKKPKKFWGFTIG